MQHAGTIPIQAFSEHTSQLVVRDADQRSLHLHHDLLNAGARVVTKAYPEEKVGVFAQRGEGVEVVEYSELDPQEAASTDPGTASSSLRCITEVNIVIEAPALATLPSKPSQATGLPIDIASSVDNML